METKQQILRQCIYEYVKPDFPQHSEERLWKLVDMFLAVTEEMDAILEAMQRYAEVYHKFRQKQDKKVNKTGF